MTGAELEAFLREKTEGLKDEEEAWTFTLNGVAMQAYTNVAKDRMRVMAMVAIIEDVDVAFIEPILRTNFHADARYGLHDRVLWAIFVHSLSGLCETDLSVGLRQIGELVEQFGKSFSAAPLRFEWPRPVQGAGGIRRRTVETVQKSKERKRWYSD